MEHGLGICKGSAEKRARGSRRSGKESRLGGAEIARVRNGAGAWRKGECWDEPKEPYAGRGRDEPRTRGCGTDAGIYEQAGTRARTKERAEGAGGKLVWGCFAFLMGLERVNATPSSRKTPFVDKIRRYVSHFRADRSRGSWRFHKRPRHNFSPFERVFFLE